MRAECSSGKVNRATGASNPEGCVLARARGPAGSHVDNWVDLNWNKTASRDERREHSLPREGSVMGGGVMKVTGQCRYSPAGLGGCPRGNQRGPFVSCHMWPHGPCGPCHTLQCKDGCPWHQAHGGPVASHWEKRVGSIPF